MNKYQDVDDNELIGMLSEEPDVVKDIIYAKYSYIVDIIIKKYNKLIKMYEIDEVDLRQEALYGLSDGINCFIEEKNVKLKTFLTICINHRVMNYFKKYTNKKTLVNRETLSLDEQLISDKPIIDIISNNKDPLSDLTENETINEIIAIAKRVLSKNEYKIFLLMIDNISYDDISNQLGISVKQIYNYVSRIKTKMKFEIDNINN